MLKKLSEKFLKAKKGGVETIVGVIVLVGLVVLLLVVIVLPIVQNARNMGDTAKTNAGSLETAFNTATK